jgi:hypothetical protein
MNTTKRFLSSFLKSSVRVSSTDRTSSPVPLLEEPMNHLSSTYGSDLEAIPILEHAIPVPMHVNSSLIRKIKIHAGSSYFILDCVFASDIYNFMDLKLKRINESRRTRNAMFIPAASYYITFGFKPISRRGIALAEYGIKNGDILTVHTTLVRGGSPLEDTKHYSSRYCHMTFDSRSEIIHPLCKITVLKRNVLKLNNVIYEI